MQQGPNGWRLTIGNLQPTGWITESRADHADFGIVLGESYEPRECSRWNDRVIVQEKEESTLCLPGRDVVRGREAHVGRISKQQHFREFVRYHLGGTVG